MTRDFERLVIERLLDEGKINREDSILVVCGTKFEKGLFSTLGFSDVTITNLDAGLSAKTFLPYKWSVQDAQNLEFDNGQFDFTFVSNGLHHCRSPHRALLEMYWVSRKGVMAFESRDNLLIRLATLLNLAERYERSSVAGRRGSAGGADCLGIPNFVYRWTERGFEKTIKAFDPAGDPEFRFYHMPRLPKFPERSWKHLAGRLSGWALRLLTSVIKNQCNCLGMVAIKGVA